MGIETTLLAIGAGAAVLSGVVSAVSAIQQGNAAAAAGDFNAEILEEQADREQQIAKRESDEERRKGSRLLAAFRAGLGGAGVTSEGTPILAQSDIAAQTELNARTIEAGGATRARRLRQEAGLERFSGSNARRQGRFNAGTSILGGVAEGGFGAAKAFEAS